MYKLFKLRIYFVAAIQFCITILPYFKTLELCVIIITQMITFLATLSFCTQEYLFGATTFILSMYQSHRYEFKRHIVPFSVLSVAVIASLLSSLSGYYFITIVSGCLITQTHMGIEQSVELCLGIFKIKPDANLSTKLYFLYIMFELLPFIFFFILNKPHDCFICLGKDPNRRFSMFQLTREE